MTDPDNRNRRARARFLVALVVTGMLLFLAIFVPDSEVHLAALISAFVVGLPLTIVFYTQLAKRSADVETRRLPMRLAIPLVVLGTVTSIPSAIALIVALVTRDELLLNVRSVGVALLAFATGVFLIWYVLRRNVAFVRAMRFRFSLRTMIILLMVGPAVIYVSLRLYYTLPAKRQYEEARIELAEVVLTEAQMDADTERLMAEVKANWKQTSSDTDGVYSQALKLIDLAPTVSNLVYLLTYRMPKFSILFPKKNFRPAVIGTIQAHIHTGSQDGHIHVSQDRSAALIRVIPKVVLIFENDGHGLRETTWTQQ